MCIMLVYDVKKRQTTCEARPSFYLVVVLKSGTSPQLHRSCHKLVLQLAFDPITFTPFF